MQPSITLVNIAAGDPDLLNAKTVNALKKAGRVFLRTSRSPVVSWLKAEKISFSSLDNLYDVAEDFDHLSSAIAEHLWAQARLTPVVYAVPDLMVDSSVQELYHLRPGDGKILAVPGVGLSDVLQSSVRPLLSSSDLRTLSALDFLLGDYDPNTSVLITELDNPILAGEVKILLSGTLEDEYRVFFLHDSASPAEIPLYELDRQPDIDHLSAVFVPGSDFMARNSFVLNDLLRIMDRLRDPDGCPWDRIQTHQSLRPYLAEEAWECIAAIDQEEPLHLANELGDLLFQIVFHSSIGKSFDEFTMNDVINSICRKMIHRHPHVFGNSSSGSSAVPSVSEWERLKRSETGSKSVLESLDDISPALPSLKYAAKLIRKISLFPAFRRDTAEIISEIRDSIDHPGAFGSETDEGRMGRFLFLCAELCDSLNLDGELILHRSVTDLKKRIQAAGEQAASDGKSMESLTFAELCVYLSHVEGEIE